MTQRRIKVRGVRRAEIDADRLALAYWLMAKMEVDAKRARDAEDKQTRADERAGGPEAAR